MEIGKVYQIKAPYSEKDSEYTTNFKWTSDVFGGAGDVEKFKKQYSTWKALDHQRAKIIKRFALNLYGVQLLSFDGVSFNLLDTYLTDLDGYVELGCICSIQKLMAVGCRCGAFQEEMGDL